MKTTLLFIFLFAALVMGGFMIGPLSVRVYISILFAGVLLSSNDNRHTQNIRKFSKTYIIFIVITVVTLLINGEFVESNYIKKFLAYYFPALLTLYGVSGYITNFQNIRFLLLLLCGIGVCTSIATWLQYIGNPLGTTIGFMFINSTLAQEEIMETLDLVLSEGAYGSGIAIGIMGFAFTNAYFISTVGAIPYLFKDKCCFLGGKLVVYAILLLLFAACFMTQERSSFFSLLVVDIFLLGGFFSLDKNNKRNQFCLIVILLIAILGYDVFLNMDMGRLTEVSMEEDTRNAIWTKCILFLREHWLLGGPVAYDRLVSVPPHNFFFSVFINSGFFGGLIASYICIKLWISVLTTITNKNVRNETRMVACCLMVSLFYSLFHNATFAEGDVLQILLCVMHLKTKELENNCRIVKN